MRKIGNIPEKKLQMMVGRTAIMYHEGKAPEEIAERLKVTIEEVNDMIEAVKNADKIKKEQES